MIATLQSQNTASSAVGPVMQCECCLRYFVNGAVFVPEAGHVGMPEVFVCGLADCGAVQAEIEARVRAIDLQGQRLALQNRQRISQAIRARREKREKGKTSNIQHPTSNIQRKGGRGGSRLTNGFERGCPRDTEPLENVEGRGSRVEGGTEAMVGSSQKEFLAVVDVGPAHAKLLEYFTKNYREWCALPVLESVCGHHAVNSRCSELRDLIPADHDIDQMNLLYPATGKMHSHYRLCLKSESVRLSRAAKRDENQGEF